jgi:hypothetical protein
VPPVSLVAARRDHLVVCGEDALACRVIEELTSRYGQSVTALLRSHGPGYGPQIASLPRVRVIERPGTDRVDWSPSRRRLLAPQDRIYVLATRAGLSGVLTRSQPPRPVRPLPGPAGGA